MRILQIESNHANAQAMELMLTSERMNVYSTDDGEEGLDLARRYDYDLIILDMQLELGSPAAFMMALRTSVQTPVLLLSYVADVDEKVRMFGHGVDDVMSRPLHKSELVARIHAIVRRSKGHATPTITCGNVTLDIRERRVRVDDRHVHLTGKEYQMMELLMLRKGTTLSKDAFLNHLYGGMDEPELKIIDVFICKLRKKLAASGASNILHTIWGRGYTLREPTPLVAA